MTYRRKIGHPAIIPLNHNLEILAILYHHHIFYFVRKCRVLSRISVICGNFYFFNLKKSVAEAHRLLVEAYGDAVLSERSCREWFQKFKNGEFDVEDKERSERPKVYENAKHYWIKIRAKRKKNLHLH